MEEKELHTMPVNREFKDSLFRLVFSEKDNLISLYNALFDTDYAPDTPVDIRTIQDIVFKTAKNDIAFILDHRYIQIVEHQSTPSRNMPLRELIYFAKLMMQQVEGARIYREKLIKIPRPTFIVMYNGQKEAQDYFELKLSDAFEGEPRHILESAENAEEHALQLTVQCYNINNKQNSPLLAKCRPLYEYSRFVELMRAYGAEQNTLTSADMQSLYAQCMEEGVLTGILKQYGTEVIEMYFKRLTQEEAMEMSREDGYEAGVEDGYTAGQNDGIMTTLDKLILCSAPLAMIFDVVELPKDTILRRVRELNPELLTTIEQN